MVKKEKGGIVCHLLQRQYVGLLALFCPCVFEVCITTIANAMFVCYLVYFVKVIFDMHDMGKSIFLFV